jgi:hypothetical protein
VTYWWSIIGLEDVDEGRSFSRHARTGCARTSSAVSGEQQSIAGDPSIHHHATPREGNEAGVRKRVPECINSCGEKHDRPRQGATSRVRN